MGTAASASVASAAHGQQGHKFVEEMSARELADAVASLGEDYADYASALRSDGTHGASLQALYDFENVEFIRTLFKKLDLRDEAHQKRLLKEYFASSPKAAARLKNMPPLSPVKSRAMNKWRDRKHSDDLYNFSSTQMSATYPSASRPATRRSHGTKKKRKRNKERTKADQNSSSSYTPMERASKNREFLLLVELEMDGIPQPDKLKVRMEALTVADFEEKLAKVVSSSVDAEVPLHMQTTFLDSDFGEYVRLTDLRELPSKARVRVNAQSVEGAKAKKGDLQLLTTELTFQLQQLQNVEPETGHARVSKIVADLLVTLPSEEQQKFYQVAKDRAAPPSATTQTSIRSNLMQNLCIDMARVADRTLARQKFESFFERAENCMLPLAPVAVEKFPAGTVYFKNPETITDGKRQESCVLCLLKESLCSISTISRRSSARNGHGNTAAQLREAIALIFDFEEEQQILEMRLSPAREITLPSAARQSAGIPANATHFCYCYPLAKEFLKIRDESCCTIDFGDPLINWLLNGGFLYFVSTDDNRIIAINAFYQGVTDKADKELSLGKSMEISDDVMQQLESWDRWWPMTLWDSEWCSIDHCWVTVAEKIAGSEFTIGGGFAYRLVKGGSHGSRGFYVPVTGLSRNGRRRPSEMKTIVSEWLTVNKVRRSSTTLQAIGRAQSLLDEQHLAKLREVIAPALKGDDAHWENQGTHRELT